MAETRSLIWKVGWALTLAVAGLGSWIIWADWPSPELKPLPWKPEAILVLGGGNEDRIHEALRLAREFPQAPVIVTGDGGRIVRGLLNEGLDPARLRHEQQAISTLDNATRTAPHMGKASRVVLVTNWFHAGRALWTFQAVHSDREFAVSFRPRGAEMTGWEVLCQRRERMAFFPYFLYWLVAPFVNR
jgi:uncharacterized SAM-binding protein YcdF (DUF218 family)